MVFYIRHFSKQRRDNKDVYTVNGEVESDLDIQFCFDYDIEELNLMGHRSGWKNVIKKLYEINNNTSDKKVLLIDIMEKTFCWDNKAPVENIFFNDKCHIVPIDELRIKREDNKMFYLAELDNEIIRWNGEIWESDPNTTLEDFFNLESNEYIPGSFKPKYDWIGILHNPQNMPKWFFYKNSPQCLLERSVFKGYLPRCKGIIVLSNYLGDWLKTQLPSTIPVSVLYHPTDDVETKFEYDKFINNEEKCIVQIGLWLRKMCAIGQIKTDVYKKIWLENSTYVDIVLRQENKYHLEMGESCSDLTDVKRIRLTNQEYDEMLSKNICFIYLYDSSANNAIIECIARNTPILVNKHPAVVEYLGEQYPYYYDTLEEAEMKMHDFSLICQTYNYLANTEEIHERISYDTFIDDFMNCEVVKNLIC